jgi:hypothetical protein
MLTIDPIVLKNPNRVADWLIESPNRFEFLVNTLFVMRQQYPERELCVELDSDDDDVLVVAPSDEPVFRFRYSEYRTIAENLEPHRDGAGYESFVERYTDWRRQFEEWWYGYQRFAMLLSSTDMNKKSVVEDSSKRPSSLDNSGIPPVTTP